MPQGEENSVATKRSIDMAQIKIFAELCGETDLRLFTIADGSIDADGPFDPDGPIDPEGQTTISSSKWKQKIAFWLVGGSSALAAATQGMDETVINGAQLFFLPMFGIKDKPFLVGLVNGAPYLCCGVFGCFLSIPTNAYWGRRGALMLGSLITVISCIAQACVSQWELMFAFRLLLGVGIGINSATTPPYAAETSPANIRGSVGMLWQFFTAFGIMLGNAVSLALFRVPDLSGISGLNWRLMMASPAVLAIVIMGLIPFCVESPRWLMQKRRYKEAYSAMCKIRKSNGEAAKECLAVYNGSSSNSDRERSFTKKLAAIAEPRNRRALYASTLVMFTQQFCGVNTIAYYSALILEDASFSQTAALAASLGLGATNFVFAVPAFFAMDRFGRKKLLLWTLPVMAVFLCITGSAFYLPDTPDMASGRLAMVLGGLLLFMIFYSPGAGPVPFPYCAEVWPDELRSIGMAINTATTWLLNFLISFTFPLFRSAFTTPGVFFYYAGWCLVCTLLIFCLVRETKMLTLEQVDDVFSRSTLEYCAAGTKSVPRRLTYARETTAWACRATAAKVTGRETPARPQLELPSQEEHGAVEMAPTFEARE